MPAAVKYDPDSKEMRQAAATELLARRMLVGEALKYYAGHHRKHLITKSGEPDDNTTVNLWKQAKDREVAFLFPKMPKLRLDEEDSSDSEAEKWLERAWDLSGGARVLRQMAKWGSLAGHVFARIMPHKDVSKPPRVVALNPANVLVWWQADDYTAEALAYELRWEQGKQEFRQDIVNLQGAWRITQYAREIKDHQQISADDGWRRTGVDLIWRFPRPPIIDWPHIEQPGDRYGTNEGELIKLNDSVNKFASDVSRILRYHASPRTIGTGIEAPEDVVPTGINNFWTVSDAAAKVYNLEMQSDLASSMNYLDFLTTAFYAAHRTVVLRGTAADFQRVTNLGVRTVFMDQSSKSEELKLTYAPGLIQICQLLRMVAGAADWQAPVRIHFFDALPQDPVEQMTALEKEIDLRLTSKQTASEERGRSWAEEQERIAEEEAAGDTATIRDLRREAQGDPFAAGDEQ